MLSYIRKKNISVLETLHCLQFRSGLSRMVPFVFRHLYCKKEHPKRREISDKITKQRFNKKDLGQKKNKKDQSTLYPLFLPLANIPLKHTYFLVFILQKQ